MMATDKLALTLKGPFPGSRVRDGVRTAPGDVLELG